MRTVYGDAKILSYQVGFSSVAYGVVLTNIDVEPEPEGHAHSAMQVLHYEQKFTQDSQLILWLRDPVHDLMKETQAQGTPDLHFQYQEGSDKALLTFHDGTAALIPFTVDVSALVSC